MICILRCKNGIKSDQSVGFIGSDQGRSNKSSPPPPFLTQQKVNICGLKKKQV